MSEHEATEAEEEYLQSIYWLHEAGLPMTAANVARAMQLSAPTVHEMVGRLEKDGYIERDPAKKLRFTPRGLEQAETIVRRHRLIERFLTDVLGIPWDEVHEEAERMEHAMSPAVEAGMLKAIGSAKTCPHGHPIDSADRIQGVPLSDVEIGAKVHVLRFENEAEDLLVYLRKAGLAPGKRGTLASAGDEEVSIELDGGGTATVTRSVSETVAVQADPSPPATHPAPRRAGARRGALRPLGRRFAGHTPRPHWVAEVDWTGANRPRSLRARRVTPPGRGTCAYAVCA